MKYWVTEMQTIQVTPKLQAESRNDYKQAIGCYYYWLFTLEVTDLK